MKKFYIHSPKSFVISIIAITIISIVICCVLYDPLTNLSDYLNQKISQDNLIWLSKIGYAFHPITFTTAFSILTFLYNSFLWKFLAKANMLTDLNGVWCGYVESSYNKKRLHCVTIIKQTFCTISIQSYFREDCSNSIDSSHSIGFDFNIGTFNNHKYISFSYNNVKSKNRSPDFEHPGFNYFYLNEDRLVGQYCAFRNDKNVGNIMLVKVNNDKKYNPTIWEHEMFKTLNQTTIK